MRKIVIAALGAGLLLAPLAGSASAAEPGGSPSSFASPASGSRVATGLAAGTGLAATCWAPAQKADIAWKSSTSAIQAGDAYCNYDRTYVFGMQADGNLVLYKMDGTAIWASGTYNHPGAYALMQADGNFVVYDANGSALWSTGTWWAGSGSVFAFQNDGNLVLYKADHTAVWASNTRGR
ncbi:hypothetical protein ACFVUY_42490 [Kitasatospora sp. NPDC058063]|uniref:hypothetical protein n=1 Tax=unclassified Kitasatospora TaxID=2633591 RepID=UPI0036DB887D